MHLECRWQNGMIFTGTAGSNTVSMDAKKPIGTDSGMTPKELVVAGLCGCTAMDVVGLLKKHQQTVDSFSIAADVEVSKSGHPAVFTKISLTFQLSGPIDPKILLQSVELSQTKYCGVSAMLSKAVDIEYLVHLNGEKVGAGRAQF